MQSVDYHCLFITLSYLLRDIWWIWVVDHSINLGAGSLSTNIALKNLIQVNHSYKHGFIQHSAETLRKKTWKETWIKDMEYLKLIKSLCKTECSNVLGFIQPTPLSEIRFCWCWCCNHSYKPCRIEDYMIMTLYGCS